VCCWSCQIGHAQYHEITKRRLGRSGDRGIPDTGAALVQPTAHAVEQGFHVLTSLWQLVGGQVHVIERHLLLVLLEHWRHDLQRIARDAPVLPELGDRNLRCDDALVVALVFCEHLPARPDDQGATAHAGEIAIRRKGDIRHCRVEVVVERSSLNIRG